MLSHATLPSHVKPTAIKLVFVMLLLTNLNQGLSQKQPSIAQQLESAELVLSASINTTSKRGLTIRVKQVFKGDQSLNDKTIHVPVCLSHQTTTPGISKIPRFKHRKYVVLFKKKWMKRPCAPFLMIYKSQQQPLVKALLNYGDGFSEEKRLKTLMSLIPSDEFKQYHQVFKAFKSMQNPDNFYLFNKLVKKSQNCRNKKSAIDIMANTYDLRAVPFLLNYLADENCQINLHAARVLRNKFAGAKGVTEAFMHYVYHPELQQTVKKYLSKRYSNPMYETEPKAPTRSRQARELLKKGHYAEATELYLSYLDDPSQSPCSRKYSAEINAIEKVLPYMNNEQLNRVYEYIQTIDFSDEEANFYVKRAVAAVLLKHPRPDYLAVKSTLLKSSLTDKQAFNASIIIFSQSDDASKQEALMILKDLYKEKKNQKLMTLVAIFWLGGDEFIDAVIQQQDLKGTRKLRRSDINTLLALRAIEGDVNDFGFLKKAALTPEIIGEWKLASLILSGLVQTEQTVTPELLSAILELNFKTTQRSISEAVVGLDTPQLHQMMVDMMDSDKPEYRRLATQTLYELDKDGSINHLRDAFNISGYGDKNKAAYLLGLVGELKDIELLKPACNYWQQDRKLSSNACRAIQFLRSKYQHDLQGPVIKLNQ